MKMINQVVIVIKILIKNYNSMKINQFFIQKISSKNNSIQNMQKQNLKKKSMIRLFKKTKKSKRNYIKK